MISVAAIGSLVFNANVVVPTNQIVFLIIFKIISIINLTPL